MPSEDDKPLPTMPATVAGPDSMTIVSTGFSRYITGVAMVSLVCVRLANFWPDTTWSSQGSFWYDNVCLELAAITFP